MSKKKEERQLQIRQILEEKEKIKVTELAKLLSVTPETLRKDLDELQERKILVREPSKYDTKKEFDTCFSYRNDKQTGEHFTFGYIK